LSSPQTRGWSSPQTRGWSSPQTRGWNSPQTRGWNSPLERVFLNRYNAITRLKDHKCKKRVMIYLLRLLRVKLQL